MKTEAGFVQQKDQIFICFGTVFNCGEPNHEAEEPDEALTALVERHCHSVAQILHSDIEVFSVIERWLILRISLDVELYGKLLVLLPVVEDLLGDGEADGLQFGL